MSCMLAKGTAVISLDTGLTMGKIENVYVDCGSRQLVAFSFGRGSTRLGRRGGHFVEVADIHAIGPDAVTLDDARAVHDLVLMDGATRNLMELDQLVKRDVITEGGAKLGHIVGLDFDPHTFRLLQVRIDDRYRAEELVIAGTDLRNIGEEVIVVTEPVTPSMDPDRAVRPARLPLPLDPGRYGSDLRRAG